MRVYYRLMFKLLSFIVSFSFFTVPLYNSWAGGEPEQYSIGDVNWLKHPSGLKIASVRISNDYSLGSTEVALVNLGRDLHELAISDSRDFGSITLSVRDHAVGHKAKLAINANFFDTENKPLGLVVDRGQIKQKLHRGGSLLTGVFYLRKTPQGLSPRIIKSSRFSDFEREITTSPLALQSGPRLISNGYALDVYRKDRATRRSGLAILESGEVILFASKSRFPGTKLAQVQALFLSAKLRARDVINFDGGSSSGLFITGNPETYISGGDPVPIALILK